jgi:hypothetical protein
MLWLLIDGAGLQIGVLKAVPDKLIAYKASITMLFLGLMWMLYHQQISRAGIRVWEWVREEVRFQLTSLRA